MTSRLGPLRAAAALLTVLCAGDSKVAEAAVDPAAELDRILKVVTDSPAFPSELFQSCLTAPTPSGNIPHSYFDVWCRRCDESGDGWSADFRFFPDPDRGACTLQQVEMSVADSGLLDPLSRRLSAAWGREPVPTPFIHEDQLWLAEPVGTPRGWRLSGSRAWLYRNKEFIGPPYLLRFLWRDDRLVEMLKSEPDDRLESAEALVEACRQAHGDGCKAIAKLNCYDNQIPAQEASFRDSLTRLAKTQRDDPSLPARLYWTQRLGECVASNARSPDNPTLAADDLGRKFPELVAVKARFGPGGYKGESIEFQSPFRALLLENHQNVRWGRQVLLESLNEWHGYADGCDTSGFAPADEVIRDGEDFLRRYPETETSDDVRLSLAKAYETWWSLSKSGSESGDLFPADLPIALAGRENAKQQALAIYRRLATKPGASPWWKDRIFRLERNIDTLERSQTCSQC